MQVLSSGFLQYFAFKCCDRLAGALGVKIHVVGLLWLLHHQKQELLFYLCLFGISFQILSPPTLRAVGFSHAKRERNKCVQTFAFPSSTRELVTPHVMQFISILFTCQLIFGWKTLEVFRYKRIEIYLIKSTDKRKIQTFVEVLYISSLWSKYKA